MKRSHGKYCLAIHKRSLQLLQEEARWGTETTKVFKRTIPLKDRDNWKDLLGERGKQIHDLTDEIVRLETLLNDKVYAVFGLNEEEIALIEHETKYKYGEW